MMLKLFLAVLFSFGVLNIMAQVDLSEVDTQKDGVGFGCGIGGMMTQAVWDMIDLLKDNDYLAIREKLFSQHDADLFIAVIVNEGLTKKKKIVLTDREIDQIKKMRNLENVIPVCSGCGYWDQVSVKTLLNKKEKHLIYRHAKSWFKFYYKFSHE